MTIRDRERLHHGVVKFVRLGMDVRAEFLVDVRNRATFNEIMRVLGDADHFRPRRCSETIGDLFEHSSRVRFGYDGSGPVIEAHFASYEEQKIAYSGGPAPHGHIELSERIAFAERWIDWGRVVQADSIGVYQPLRNRKRDIVYGGQAGPEPTGIRLWWD